MSHSDISLTEPILIMEGIEPVLAHYSSLFDNIRKDSTEQIRVYVSSAVDSLFDVYVDYIKTITKKAYSVANFKHLGEKYVPLALVESGARVMQTKLRQLMSTEIDATSSKLSELLKAPLRLPLNTQNYSDDDVDQHDSESRAILDQLETNLEDISDVDDDEDDDNENTDQIKRKRNKQKRQTELSCEKIAQMSVLIRKLERYQLLEQTMLLRRLKEQKKGQIDQQLVHQQTSSSHTISISDFANHNEQTSNECHETIDLEKPTQLDSTEQQFGQSYASSSGSTSVSYIVNNNEQSQPSSNDLYETNQHVPELTQSEPTEQQFSQSLSTSNSTSSVVDQFQTQNPNSSAPKPAQLRKPGIYQIAPPSNIPINTQQHSTLSNLSGTDQVALYRVRSANPIFTSTSTTPIILRGVLNNPSITHKISNASNLPSSYESETESASEEEELSNSVTRSDQNVDYESDDEVTFLEEVDPTANRIDQNGETIQDGDLIQQNPQPDHEQIENDVQRSAQQTTNSHFTSNSDFVNDNFNEQSEQTSSNEINETYQSGPIEQQLSQSPSISNSTSSVVNQSQTQNPTSHPKRTVRLILRESGVYRLEAQSNVPITTLKHSSTNRSGTDQVPLYLVRPLTSTTSATPTIPERILSNPSITNQVSNALPTPSEELCNSVTHSDQVQTVDNESDDEVTFLEEVDSAAYGTNQDGSLIRDVRSQQDPQTAPEQAGGNVQRSALVSKRMLMDQHLLSVHHTLPYNCLVSCEAKFATLDAINAHLAEQHPEIKSFSCGCYNFSEFKSYSDLFLHHENRHPQVGVCGCSVSNCTYKVGWCDVLEMARRSLSRENFDDKMSRVVCPFRGCGLNLATLRVAREHLLAHIEDRPFVCSFCKEKFKQKHNCRNHIRNVHFSKQELAPEQANNHIQLCGSLCVEQAQSDQLMDNLFIHLRSQALGIASIVLIKPIQAQLDRSVPSKSSNTPSLSIEQESDSIQCVEDIVDSVETNFSKMASSTIAAPFLFSTSSPSTSSANSFNEFRKRILITSKETPIRPSKNPKS